MQLGAETNGVKCASFANLKTMAEKISRGFLLSVDRNSVSDGAALGLRIELMVTVHEARTYKAICKHTRRT